LPRQLGARTARHARHAGADRLRLVIPRAFEAPDFKRYPGLALAWQTLRSAEGTTTVLNAANETAVAGFLDGTIRFDQIHSVIAHALDRVDVRAAGSDTLEALLALDDQARRQATEFVKGLAP
jgi:1-deoxy-D-xylulose-5-phosphate reductoisomerase